MNEISTHNVANSFHTALRNMAQNARAAYRSIKCGLNWLVSLLYDYRNPYAYLIKRILKQKIDYSRFTNPEVVKECDTLFEDRWRRNRQAYRISFWKNHFEIMNLIREGVLRHSDAILDFGCGTGNIDIELANCGYNITGVELSPKAVEIANLYRADMPIWIKDRLRFFCADIREFKTERLFNICIMLHVLEHIADPQFIFSSLDLICVRPTKIWISVPFADYYDDPTNVHHYYSVEEFRDSLNPFGFVQKINIDSTHNVIQALLIR